jgi:alpha-D-xyloside xylohydrolase
MLNPIFRMHGYQTETEPWKYGQTVEDNMRKMLNLRYRLLPYIYSEAWQITKNGSTMMRGMVMDFNGDTTAVNRQYQYMFGKALLVSPVTESGVTKWSVYLPKYSSWYDFWTGQRFDGGQYVKTDAPIDKIPLFVKAGSVVPMGKIMQYAGEKKADTLEIRIYKGAGGIFDLYEDEGDNYNYEKGNYTIIPFVWDEQKHTLAIGDRLGGYPGMSVERTFKIILVTENSGIGIEYTQTQQKLITYKGKKIVIQKL